jgi:hydrogenase expression/formation protein HypE
MSNDLNALNLLQCPLPISDHDTVQLGHGSGGKMTGDLISKLFLWAFDNPVLARLDDSAVVGLGDSRLAISTDSFVVDPIFFPGGDIGELAVYGTVNDVAMSGARPVYISLAFILEEGLPLADLKRIVESIRRAAARANVTVVTGDTKVLNRGKGDKIFINTTGIGILEHDYDLSSRNLRPGDQLILSGGLAEHGMAILSRREGLEFETPIRSDTAPLIDVAQITLDVGGDDVRAMRDATRGGLAAVANEFAVASGVGIRLYESEIPVSPPVAGACEFLGFDPLHVANEGKMVVAAAGERAAEILEAIRKHPLGADAAIIGAVTSENAGMVSMQTRIGGWRIVDMMVGEQLPRIC